MTPFEITALMFTSMVCLMLLGVPITFCLGSVGILSTFFLWGAFALDGVYFAMVNLMSNIVLTALPLYLFMGFLLQGCVPMVPLTECMPMKESQKLLAY